MQGWRGGTVGEGLCGGKACGGHRLAEGEGRRPGGEAADTGCGPVPAGSKILRRAGRCGMIDGGKNHGTVAEGRAEQCRKR